MRALSGIHEVADRHIVRACVLLGVRRELVRDEGNLPALQAASLHA
jgi:hypothetical protein